MLAKGSLRSNFDKNYPKVKYWQKVPKFQGWQQVYKGQKLEKGN